MNHNECHEYGHVIGGRLLLGETTQTCINCGASVEVDKRNETKSVSRPPEELVELVNETTLDSERDHSDLLLNS